MTEKNKAFKLYIYGISDEYLNVELSKYIEGIENTRIVNSFIKNILNYMNKYLKLNMERIYIYANV
jgi:hypothetical protein